tara:strand:+ start:3228 stop:3401 length:174 start_codon:yes stop_codon:yes gene_type:complete
MTIAKITFDGADGKIGSVIPERVTAKSFTGVERKLKDKEIVAIIKIEDQDFLAFIKE